MLTHWRRGSTCVNVSGFGMYAQGLKKIVLTLCCK